MAPHFLSPPPVLAYGDGDFNGYWLLALLLITFVNWVATQLKRRRALKRGEPYEVDPADFAPYLERTAQRPTEEEREAAPETAHAREEIRDFFAALTGQPPTPPKPKPEPARPPEPSPRTARQSASPPPVPARPRGTTDSAYQSDSAPANTYLSRIAAAKKRESASPGRKTGPTEAQKLAAASYQRQFGSNTKARSSRNRTRHDAMVRLLRDPESVRTAFVLREVLGPPKGLQSDTDAPTL